MSKIASEFVDSKRFKFDERQLEYIRRSHRDAVKAGYITKDEVLHVQRPSRLWDDEDKADLLLPSKHYWDTVPV